MVFSIRALCSLGAAAAAISTTAAQTASNCTEAEATQTSDIIGEQSAGILYCSFEICSRECVQTATAMASKLPNCVYSLSNSNYYEIMTGILAQCGTGSASGSQPAVVGACSDDERTATTSFLEANARSLGGHCREDTCSSDCVADLTTLTESLADCTFDDIGVNYNQAASSLLASCNGSSSAVGGDESTGSEFTACSPTQAGIVEIVTGAYRKDYATECATDCTSSCKAVVDELLPQLPDCITDGSNYFYGVVSGTAQLCTFSGSTSSGVGDLGVEGGSGSSAAGTSSVGFTDAGSSNGATAATTMAVSVAVASVALAISQMA